MKREDVIALCVEAQKYSLTSFSGDFIRKSIGKRKILGFEFNGFSETVNSMKSYYDSNMALLNCENRERLFLDGKPVYTKVRDDFPASYGLQAKASNSLIADGCIIEGTVENSVLFRGVTVAKGTVVRNSILMQGTHVGENSSLDCVVTDKNVEITAGSTLSGSKNYPVYFSKGKTV
jgi:glucose-1-phosphate adenylyltransferase